MTTYVDIIGIWIDELAKIWEISYGFATVKSYRLVERSDYPSAINPADLDRQPVALTMPAMLQPEYSEGGPLIGFWRGITEFHVSPDIDNGRLPSLMPWYGLILNAATSHMKLNNKVEFFLLDGGDSTIQGPVGLKYGDEKEHWGFIVQWRVKQRLEGLITVSR